MERSQKRGIIKDSWFRREAYYRLIMQVGVDGEWQQWKTELGSYLLIIITSMYSTGIDNYSIAPTPQYFLPLLSTNLHALYSKISLQQQQLRTLKAQNQDLKKKIDLLEFSNQRLEPAPHPRPRQASCSIPLEPERRRRKTFNQEHLCPYFKCEKFYGSSLALNLHIKLKHNGGTKKERETYAKIILNCEKKGVEAPIFDCEFPPGFMEEQRKRQFALKPPPNRR